MKFLHLSDLHLRDGWHEEQGLILKSLFEDLESLTLDGNPIYLVFSGDVVKAGEKRESFDLFARHFDARLKELGVGRAHRIPVPGNHDMSRNVVERRIRTFLGFARMDLTESAFNDAIYGEYRDLMKEKFTHYLSFEEQYAQIRHRGNVICGPRALHF